MITSRPVLNNVYLPQNKLLKRPVFSKMVKILSKKQKKKKKQLSTVTSCIPTVQRQ